MAEVVKPRSFGEISALLRESEDCIKLCRLDNTGPIRRLISLLALEIGMLQGENYKLREQLKAAGIPEDGSRVMDETGVSGNP